MMNRARAASDIQTSSTNYTKPEFAEPCASERVPADI